MNPVTITINGRSLSVAPELTILEAARQHGIHIPTLCFNETLPSRGSCWICIVEIKGKNRFIPSCSTKVAEGMVIETSNAELNSMRRQSLERIIAMHCGDCLAPCERSCPAECDIAGFISAIASGNDRDAISIILRTIPLPGILGRVCPAPCEEACRRHGVDEPVSICALKRFAADRQMAHEAWLPEPLEPSGKSVAIVGAGPAGLTAAWFLLLAGHGVTVIDAAEKAGGMMRYGIPGFRLPEQVIDADIEPLIRLGVKFRFSTIFGMDTGWSELKREHDALLLGIGASKATRLDIPGENLAGVKSGIAFLRDLSTGTSLHPGQSVVVIGGGNTAIDAARSALRLGASSVTVMYRRGREEMPANRVEIEEAAAEGVTFRLLAAPVAIEKTDDALLIRAVSMQLGEPDSSGRRRPLPIEGSEFSLRADTIITASGQSVDLPSDTVPGIAFERDGAIRIETGSMQTTAPGVFAAGDCVSGPDLAIQAVRQGRLAAEAIDRYLRGIDAAPAEWMAFNSSYGQRDQAPQKFYQRARRASRVPVPELPAELRQRSFSEAVTGYGEHEARAEALRCLQCRCQAAEGCTLRNLATEAGITSNPGEKSDGYFSIDSNGSIRFEREKCVDCGICIRTLDLFSGMDPDEIKALLTENCPTGAISRKGR
ncbi:MAG: FAD-dependent oxidoreductase [Chlorobiaceae bacterium]|nr:FAD-dependent oxidoreductase [Chlorobiaceae bacterium]